MKNLSRVLFGTVLVAVTSASVFAATTGYQDLIATVGEINSMAVTDAGATMSGVNVIGLSDVAVCNLTLNNNSPTGFKVTLSSEKAGKMVRQVSGVYTDTSKTGNWLAYTISVDSGTGILGTDAPSLPSDHSLSADQDIVFNTNVDRSTVDKVYTIKVSSAAKNSLFHGSFKDTITATIANI